MTVAKQKYNEVLKNMNNISDVNAENFRLKIAWTPSAEQKCNRTSNTFLKFVSVLCPKNGHTFISLCTISIEVCVFNST